MPRGKSNSAFTLIELMLSIAIISILISILLPVAIRAKAAAMTVQCQSRLAQIMIGAISHAGDHKDQLPYPNWRGTLSDEPASGWLYTAPVLAWDGDARTTGTLWNYLLVTEVYHCRAHSAEQEGSAAITSYLMNGSVMAYGDTARAPRPFRLDQFRTMSGIFWDAEDVDPVIESGVGGDRTDGATWPGVLPRARHGNAINMAVIDGSAIRMTMERYQAEQLKKPGMLWCTPNSRTGE